MGDTIAVITAMIQVKSCVVGLMRLDFTSANSVSVLLKQGEIYIILTNKTQKSLILSFLEVFRNEI